jgi:hypothetical protein
VAHVLFGEPASTSPEHALVPFFEINTHVVIAGLDPAIHQKARLKRRKMDARVKPRMTTQCGWKCFNAPASVRAQVMFRWQE